MRSVAKPKVGAQVVSDPDRAGHLAEILKAVAHPLRLRIIALLCQEERSVNRIAELLEANQAIVSQQLRILRLHGLVEAERRDGLAVYRILEPRLRQLVACLEGCRLAPA